MAQVARCVLLDICIDDASSSLLLFVIHALVSFADSSNIRKTSCSSRPQALFRRLFGPRLELCTAVYQVRRCMHRRDSAPTFELWRCIPSTMSVNPPHAVSSSFLPILHISQSRLVVRSQMHLVLRSQPGSSPSKFAPSVPEAQSSKPQHHTD